MSSDEKTPAVPFTDHESELLLTEDGTLRFASFGRRQKDLSRFTMMLLFFNAMWMAFLVMATYDGLVYRTGPELIWSPARSAVSYEKIETHSTPDNTNKFRGPPTPENTRAWTEDYLQWAMITISEEELHKLGKSSIQLTDGSGYLATLGVLHQIHCLNMIREYIFDDYYNSTEAPDRHFLHMDHCIDAIRLALMCHSDISIITFDWHEYERSPDGNFQVEHECRNFDRILDWAKPRKVDMSLVVHPKFGQVQHE